MNRRLALMKLLILANKSAIKISEAADTNSTKALRAKYASQQDAFTTVEATLNELRKQDLNDLRARMHLSTASSASHFKGCGCDTCEEVAEPKFTAETAREEHVPPMREEPMDPEAQAIVDANTLILRDGASLTASQAADAKELDELRLIAPAFKAEFNTNVNCPICCQKVSAPIANDGDRQMLRAHFLGLHSHDLGQAGGVDAGWNA